MKNKDKLTIGVIGLGQRGNGLLTNILNNSEVEVTAICDIFDERIDKASSRIVENGNAEPFKSNNFMDIVNHGVDAIIVSTGWSNHIEVSLAAMEAGVPVAMEVGGTHSIEDCWKLVDCYERTKSPFMFLENCCFARDEMLVTSLFRNGVLGEVAYCQGYYCHDLREEIAGGIDTHHYRLNEYKNYNCENYPTHELGPIAKILNINRGNRFTKLVSMASKSIGMEHFIKNTEKYSERLRNTSFHQGDVVTTMLQCENGETILLKLDTTLPRLYERGLTVSGTKGFYCQTTKAVVLDNGEFNHETAEYSEAFFSQEKYTDYLPDDWRLITEEQKNAGHGGMDYIMLNHFFRAVKNNQDMPIDIYDAVAWMSITALSEISIKSGSNSVPCPDFTRGKYKEREVLDVLSLPVIEK